MSEETRAGDPYKDESSPPPPSERPRPIESTENRSGTGPDPQGAITKDESNPRIRLPEWVMAFATVGMLVAAFASLYVSRQQWDVSKRQWEAMTEQLVEMRSSGQQTDRMIAANERLVDAARDNASAAKANAEIAKRALEVSQRGLALSRSALETTERASIVPKEFAPITITANTPAKTMLAFENSGRSAAINVRALGTSRLYATGAAPDFTHEKTEAEPSVTSLGAGQLGRLEIKIAPFQDPIVRAIEAGAITLFVYGTVTYEDIFGRKHGADFCVRYGHPNAWLLCSTHNRIW